MKRALLYLLCWVGTLHTSQGQALNAPTQKKLNQQIQFIDYGVEFVVPLLKCLHSYHEDVERYRHKQANLRYYPRYQCSRILDPQTYETAQASVPSHIRSSIDGYWAQLQKIDKQAKELEVYIRLEDYKQDGFKKSDEILQSLSQLYSDLQLKKRTLESEIFQHANQQDIHGQANFVRSQETMRQAFAQQRQLFDSWEYNLNETSPVTWDPTYFEESIRQDQVFLSQMTKSTLPYPVNQMYKQFQSNLKDLQKSKSYFLDNYNFQARQSDKDPNEFYLNRFLNYYNDVLCSFHDKFVEYAQQKGVYLLKHPKLSPRFILNKEAVHEEVVVKKFEERDIAPLNIQANSEFGPIPPPILASLNLHIEYINETIRINDQLCRILENYQSSSHRLIQAEDLSRRAKPYFPAERFKLLKSEYEIAKLENQKLPEGSRDILLEQIEVLFDITREMEELAVQLQLYNEKKGYEQDRFALSEKSLQRFAYLYDQYDERKERFYSDLRKIYDAYPQRSPSSSWQKSGNALLQQVEADRQVIFTLKRYFKGDSSSLPDASEMDAITQFRRALIQNQYENMAGIKRIGRNHGRCPYNPYEDIATYSGQFRTKVEKLPETIQRNHNSPQRSYDHYIRTYKQIVEQYNRFNNLSEIERLNQIYQPLLFFYLPPQPKPKSITTSRPSPGKNDTLPQDFYQSMEGYALNHLVFLLDVSSSMNSPEKLPLLKKAMFQLLGIMRPDDRISMVVYSGNARSVLNDISAQDTSLIRRSVEELSSGGNTNAEEGIKLAYKLAKRNFIPAGNNRILMATDGAFPLKEDTFELIQKQAAKDIQFSVLEFGEGSKHKKLVRLAQEGEGQYHHLEEDNAAYYLIKEAKAKRNFKRY